MGTGILRLPGELGTVLGQDNQGVSVAGPSLAWSERASWLWPPSIENVRIPQPGGRLEPRLLALGYITGVGS